MIRQAPISTLFPYTTLFRSALVDDAEQLIRAVRAAHDPDAVLGQCRPQRALEAAREPVAELAHPARDRDRKSTRLNSSHANISYAVFCLKKKNITLYPAQRT